MIHRRRASRTLFAVLTLALSTGSISTAQREREVKKPSLSLKATPPVGFAPLRVRVVLDLRGGDDDHVDFYCPSLQFEWGDDLSSERSEDCAPYQPGTSTIARHYTAQHEFRQPGSYRVLVRLKQNSRTVATASTVVQVRPGLGRDDYGG